MSTDKTFFGHPRGLATLFFTEMWERFSYYGMRALLLLFMVASIETGGMGLSDETGGAIYGLYTMFVYLFSLPGGWLADKLLGLRKSIFYGGCIIALGHFCLAFPAQETFFLGLLFIIIGTGMLKPNVSSMVGEIYPAGDQVRRDAGFSIFFMGINSGALISPIIVGYLGQKIDWHYGFAAAGIGMVLGVIQYRLTEGYLGDVGLYPARQADPAKQQVLEGRIKIALAVFAVLLTILVVLLWTRTVIINPVAFAQGTGSVLLVAVLLYFAYVFTFEKLTADEKKKVLAIFVFFIATTAFYAGYEGQGSSLTLFADRYTDLTLPQGWQQWLPERWLRWISAANLESVPASWLQSAPPVFVIIFVPVFTWLWSRLAKKGLNPSTPVKMGLGLLWMGLGYLVMMGAAGLVMHGSKPGMIWLVTTYALHTFGEICLYPIGLSGVTKLAPKRLVGQMMGVFFMALALGNLFAGLYAGKFSEKALEANPMLMTDLFALIVKIMFVGGVLVLIFAKPIRKLMGDVR